MACETEGEFTFTWNVTIGTLFDLKNGETLKSPIFLAEKLKKTKWYLELKFLLVPTNGIPCYLHRHSDKSSELFMLITFTLELIDSSGNVLNSIEQEHCFTKGSNYDDYSLINLKYLGLLKRDGQLFKTDKFTIRCTMINECYKTQAMVWEVPSSIQTQWKINTGISSWSKRTKIPLQGISHFDVTVMSDAPTEPIKIEIRRFYLLQPCKLKLRILNDEGTEIEFECSKIFQPQHIDNMAFTTKIKKSQLVDESRFQLPFSFTIVCTITNSNRNLESESKSYYFVESLPSVATPCLPLQGDLKLMLLNGKHSDVELRSLDKIMPAHKCLLSIRSPVFAAMFDQDMLETRTGIVDIPDIESETLQSFLDFLYTDTIANTDCKNILKLMLVAEKYQVNILKQLCCKILMKTMTVKNVGEIITAAEMVNELDLKQSAIRFIKANKERILTSREWNDWVKKNLKSAVDILSKLVIN